MANNTKPKVNVEAAYEMTCLLGSTKRIGRNWRFPFGRPSSGSRCAGSVAGAFATELRFGMA